MNRTTWAITITILSGALPSVAEVAPGTSAHAAAETFLAERLPFWQKRLNLAEWKIMIAMSPRSALKPGTLGGIRWDKTKRIASMTVLSPADYRVSVAEMLKDMEFTLVHELVHLQLAALPRSEASRGNEETAVNNLTRALLASAAGQ